MNPSGQRILDALQSVASERDARNADAEFGRRVRAVKAFQHARFERTYADTLSDPRYGAAATFFLDDLYGPSDFTDRDQQFARIVPALVRLFPGEIVETVSELGALHALSERLDSAMARQVGRLPLEAADYAQAWRSVGEPESRQQQIDLTVSVGRALDRFTRRAVLRHTLRLMRGPASAAGLGALQRFLERGFDTFRAMRGAEAFLQLIAARERELAQRLFAGATTLEL